MRRDIDCTYCGCPADSDYGFCVGCWQDLCGELQERIIFVRNQCGKSCEHFANVIKTALRFLIWLDEDDEEDDDKGGTTLQKGPPPLPPQEKPKKPEYDPDDPDWWKK